MKKSLLPFLVCPECRSDLGLNIFREDPNQEIEEGELSCIQCSQTFVILNGIPRFLSKKVETKDQATQERFAYEWMRYPGSLPEDESIFLEETQIDRSEWNGKIVLDAGCGMGRYSLVAHDLGATVIACDLSEAMTRLRELSLSSDRLHLIQGNLLSLPLKRNMFDIVYSLGVIHHTPSARGCVRELCHLLKKGGRLTLWVYGKSGTYGNFKTNPIREGRTFLRKILPYVWSVVAIRGWYSGFLRFFTVRLPHNVLYRFCYLLAWMGSIPGIQYLTFSVHPLFAVRLQENFDWLSPPYQSHHTKEELISWFEENGLEIEKILPHGFVPKPGVLGSKR